MLSLYIPFLSTDRLRERGNVSTSCLSESSRRLSTTSEHVPPEARVDLNRDREGSASRDLPMNSQSSIAKPQSSIPLATLSPCGQALRIVHVNRTAGECGVRPGQTLADAKAVAPELVTYDDDPEADRRQLETLAVWAQCLSPTVHIEGDDTFLIDVTGCERVFDGESNLLRQALKGLDAQGFEARGAVADTPGAAWAISHADPEPAVIAEPGATAAYLAPLPAWSLRIDAATTATLGSVGVKTVGSLLYLPRSSLTSRFGDGLLDRIDQALGDLPEVLISYRPKPALASRMAFPAAIARMDILTEAVHRTTERFCTQLDRRKAGVRRMFVTFDCPDVATGNGARTRRITVEVSLSQPTRSVNHLHLLLAVRLEGLRLPAPAESLTVWAREIDRLDDRQDELFDTGSRDVQTLGELLDRLAVRLGSHAVVRPQLLSEHQPERAFRYVSLVGVDGASSSRIVDPPAVAPRPLRLKPRPVQIATAALVPEGPPISFRHDGAQHAVARCAGPERIETGWWRGPHVQRDYYRVTTKGGCHCWIFRDRDTGQWFLHGWFD